MPKAIDLRPKANPDMISTATPDKVRVQLDENYSAGTYWADRMDMMYYRYVDYIVRTLAHDATSLIDVGSANCPYLDWFDWIPEKVSFDRAPPYQSDQVTGMQGDFMTHPFDRKYDVCLCLQVLEHIPRVRLFARRLMAVSDLVIISVPYNWPATMMEEHVNDPVDLEKVQKWFGRKANYHIIVEEPFRARKRLIAVFAADKKAGWGKKHVRQRMRRTGGMGPTEPAPIEQS